MITFAHPHWLLLLGLLPFYWGFHFWRERRWGAVPVSRFPAAVGTSFWFRIVPLLLRSGAFALCVLALASPERTFGVAPEARMGIDIVLALDLSGSMRAEDLRPNRFEAAQAMARAFIQSRTQDRIGLVAFAGEAYTASPLVTDYGFLLRILDDLRPDLLEDGTAIGMGLATAVAALRTSRAPSRVIVLLTDGQNNRGPIAPETAAELARQFGIRVYTIGVGTRGEAPYPIEDSILGRRYVMVRVDVDEPTLEAIAARTGGRYFRATDNTSLERIYREIDQLERYRIVVPGPGLREPLYPILLLAALGLLVLDFLLSGTRLRALL
ncbi:MAG: VWA domain-containing protein [Bacteroidetes bacterium]|nr:VWA domain-containing protein [Rhodothermia bacterium]MCS7155001.1 VWA domain-containing protein [Bacteroidota bacterium]MCX7907285.1 VWA domain-containing protein [Bacteroidota bacterium]MDW8137989.1 VWA domain-containing protein [Bacteroidota bacterium]MDW8286159.1 VWA domain-containing protein [Bacteroidota bacterium]